MGDTSRGAATSLTEQRTNQMILLISIGIVFTLAVGGFAIAANYLGDQDQSPIDNQQTTVLDNFDLVETANLQTEREIDFVLGSESGEQVYDTETGTITILDYNFPSGPLPLCLTSDIIDTWFFNISVTGGYELVCGHIDVWQKGVIVGTIYLDWVSRHGERCCIEYWYITFHSNDICLESNQYPEVIAPFDLSAPFNTIPGKEVTFDLDTCWCGCCEPDQHFTITPTHLFLSFSRCLILSPMIHFR